MFSGSVEWNIRDVKDKIETAIGVPVREQRLCIDDCEVFDAQLISTVHDDANKISCISLVRRAPEQAYWLEQVALSPAKLAEVPQPLRADREIVLLAVERLGWPLQYAADELKADRTLVMAALRVNGHALKYVAEELKSDVEIVIRAVQSHCDALLFAADSLKQDRELLLKVMQVNGSALEHAPYKFRSDYAFVAKAVAQDERAIVFACEELQNDQWFSHIAAAHCSMFSQF